MAYIVGISRLYVGQNAAGLALLLVGILLGWLFWRGFMPYIRELLSEEERADLDAVEAEPSRTVQIFGLAGLLAVLAFATAAVFGLNALLFLKGGTAAAHTTGAAIAMLAGFWLWRKHKQGEVG